MIEKDILVHWKWLNYWLGGAKLLDCTRTSNLMNSNIGTKKLNQCLLDSKLCYGASLPKNHNKYRYRKECNHLCDLNDHDHYDRMKFQHLNQQYFAAYHQYTALWQVTRCKWLI